MTNEEAYQSLNSRNRAMADQIIKALNYAQSNTTAAEQDLDAMAEERWQEYCKQQEREKQLHQQQYM